MQGRGRKQGGFSFHAYKLGLAGNFSSYYLLCKILLQFFFVGYEGLSSRRSTTILTKILIVIRVAFDKLNGLISV